MNAEYVSHISQLNLTQNEWNALLSQSSTNTPFQTFEWFSSWWSVFGDGYSLCLLLFREEGVLVGIAPFMIEKKWATRELRFISDVNGDYCDFIAAHAHLKTVITAALDFLLENRSIWNSIFLRNIPAGSETPKILGAICKSRKLFQHSSFAACPVLKISDINAATWKMSKTFRRHFNYFSRNGELNFSFFSDIDEATEALEPFFKQHIKRWEKSSNPSLFTQPKYKEFYRKLLTNAWPSGWLFFSSLRFNSTAIAYHFGFDYNSRIIWYKPSFNTDFSNRSPGRLLIKYLIDFCIKNNRSEFDFTLGNEPFKLEYTESIRNNTNIRIFKYRYNYFFHHILKAIRQLAKKMCPNKKAIGLLPWIK